jgi:ABC-type nickel/cobalt efflux system permease component RcnA
MASYEFSEAQNQKLSGLRSSLLQVAILFLVLGVVQLVTSFLVADESGRWVSLAASLLLLGLGWLYIRPLDNLTRVIHTKGQDIRQIMIAFSDLRVAFLGGEVILVVLVATIIVEIMRLSSPG